MLSSLYSFAVTDGLMNSFDMEHFHTIWVCIFAIVWALIRKFISMSFDVNPGRTVGIIHALFCISMGLPVLSLLTETSFWYYDMLYSMIRHRVALNIICHTCCYVSVGYFIMDSYFLLKTNYLKHHIGAIVVWLLAAFHYETSLIHGVMFVSIFETGAILVQLSRFLSNNIPFRALICIGYTLTRITVSWYWGFSLYTSLYYSFGSHMSVIDNILNIPIHLCLIFLVCLNLKWTYLQWKSLYRAYCVMKPTEKLENFHDVHQKVIGNVRSVSAPTKIAA